MAYTLLLSKPSDKLENKDIGENVFLNNLSHDYKVYLFYYPGIIPNVDLEDKLRMLGNDTGKNLFVNIGRRNDPNFDKIVDKFRIREYPVIIITGLAELASFEIEDKFSTVYIRKYVRLDKRDLIGSIDSTIRSIESLFSLFINGKIYEATAQAKHDQREAVISHAIDMLTNELGSIGKFLWNKDISVSLAEGKFELKSSGRSLVK
jgi:hypothetical protein